MSHPYLPRSSPSASTSSNFRRHRRTNSQPHSHDYSCFKLFDRRLAGPARTVLFSYSCPIARVIKKKRKEKKHSRKRTKKERKKESLHGQAISRSIQCLALTPLSPAISRWEMMRKGGRFGKELTAAGRVRSERRNASTEAARRLIWVQSASTVSVEVADASVRNSQRSSQGLQSICAGWGTG